MVKYDQEKIKRWYKQHIEDLCRRDKRMTSYFEEKSYDEELEVLESEDYQKSTGKK